jgi:peptidyl-prolyl cis-trans isomerase B (cyclophilin B)
MMMKRIIFACIVLFAGKASAQRPHYEFIAIRGASDTIGKFEVEMYPAIAKEHVRNFDSLVAAKFFDSTAFHRVIPGFVIQGGDPNSKKGPRSTWGFGQPWQQNVPAEFNPISHIRGVFSAARDNDINSANSQFFVCVAPALHLDWNYTAYGKVISGMNVVDNIVTSPRDATDNPIQKIEMFVTRVQDDTNRINSIATITQPLNNAIGISASYLFKWNAVQGALIYELEFSRQSNFATIDTIIKTAALQASFPTLKLGEQRYYWRLKANDGAYKTTTSINTFSTGLFAPALVSPINNSVMPSNTVNLEWQNISAAGSYRIIMSTSPAFTPSSIRLDSSGIIGNTVQLKNLLANRKYYWKIASEINGISGDFSSAWAFTTGIATSVEENKNEILVVYPNPSSGKITFNNNSITEVEIFDINSKLLKRLEVINSEILIDDLNSGIYILKAKDQNKVYRARIILNKEN